MDNVSIEVQSLNTTGSSVVQIKLDPQSISKASDQLARYKNLPRKFRPALEDVADYVRGELIPQAFQKEGPGWPQLSKRSQFERAKRGFGPKHPILKRTGDLYKELTERGHPNHVETIRVGKNARIELGGSSVKFIQNQLGKGDPGQRLPQRSMIPGTGNLPLNERDRMRIKDILTKAIESQ